MIRDSLGVPQEPSELPNIHIGYDWVGQEIYSDDNDEYILLDGEYILDDPDQIRAYVLQHAVILDTMQIWMSKIDGA